MHIIFIYVHKVENKYVDNLFIKISSNDFPVHI